jgi:hypothetical protein
MTTKMATTYEMTTDSDWEAIVEAYLNTEAGFEFEIDGIDFMMDYTQSGRHILWADGEVIAWSCDGVDDLRSYVERYAEERGWGV